LAVVEKRKRGGMSFDANAPQAGMAFSAAMRSLSAAPIVAKERVQVNLSVGKSPDAVAQALTVATRVNFGDAGRSGNLAAICNEILILSQAIIKRPRQKTGRRPFY